MKKLSCLAVMLMATATLPGSVLAQGRGAPTFWAAKPARLTPFVAPNRVHWKLSEILAA